MWAIFRRAWNCVDILVKHFSLLKDKKDREIFQSDGTEKVVSTV